MMPATTESMHTTTHRAAEAKAVRKPLPFWRGLFAVLALGAGYATWLRFTQGLGAVTNLTDQFPWGIWVGFDILCGVALAAGGFTLVAGVHILHLERYKPILRPAVLTAFLGYLLVIFALMYDLGRPWRIWHPLIMWNPHSVMFEVGWCVTLYTTVLALEFAPVICEKFGWRLPLNVLHAISVPLMIVGVILSTLHQSSLGTLYLIVPGKLDALWYSPFMPFFFFLSAICAGLAMTVFESWHSGRSFGRALEMPLLAGMGRLLALLLSVYLFLRFFDLARRGALAGAFTWRTEAGLFWLETALLLVPALLLCSPTLRLRPWPLYVSSLSVVFGMIANRMNVAITGMEAGSGASYIPRWSEAVVTLFIIALGFAIFRFAAKHLPVFEESHE